MKRLPMLALSLLCLTSLAQADVFNLGPGLTNLETVAVGDAGNAADTRYGGYGSVDYTYNVGKYEVTAAQYCDFLNHKAKSDPYALYHTGMWGGQYGCKIERQGELGNYSYSVAADWANRPVNYITFWDACRFVNWLSNGQGDGDTETGTYTLDGYSGSDGSTIQRNVGWKWAVPTDDEWYKAAYYDPNKPGGAGYWDYPTRSNDAPSNVGSDGYTDPGNHANFKSNDYTIGSPYYSTVVGEFENSASAYGTFDQGGNVWEKTETVNWGFRGSRGGSYGTDISVLHASIRSNGYPNGGGVASGFRVVQAAPVAEPSSLLALAGGLVSILALRRRQR